MRKVPQRIIVFFSMIVFLCSVAGATQRIDCTVVVVDVLGKAVPDADVVAYELESDYVTDGKTINTLCSGKTNSTGKLEMSVDCMWPMRCMIVARKAGYTLGWDMLPYNDFAQPIRTIILDKPVLLWGRVVDHQGNPVEKARVQALPKTSKLDRLEQSPLFGPSEWMSTETDDNGRFEFKCFGEEVSADFLVTAPGSSTVYQFTPYSTSSCGYQVGREDICLALPQPVTVRGCVVDESGKAISGMTMVVRRDHRDENYFKNNYVPLSCETDEKGCFVFEGLPPVSHFMNVLNTDISKPWADKAIIVNAADPNERENIKIQLCRGGILQLTMIDGMSQKPIQDMMLFLSKKPVTEKEWWFSRDFKTDLDGRVKAMCPAGKCGFRFWDDRYQADEGLDLPLIKKGQKVSVLFELEPIPFLKGMVRNPDGVPAQNVSVIMTWAQRVLTDKTGAFVISYDDLRDDMVVMARDIENNRAAFVVIGDLREPMALRLVAAKTLTGQVTDVQGQPLPVARVSVSIDGPGYLSGGFPEVLTDQMGKFMFTAVPAKLPEGFSFRLSVATMNHGAFSYERLDVQHQSDETIELKPIRMTPVDRVMDGIVLDENGEPMASLPIFVHGKGQYKQTATTDENGRFQFRRLRDGEVYLQAGIGPEGFKPGRVTAHSGDTNVKIYMGQSRRHVPEISIKNKFIPTWDSIEYQNDIEPIKGKPLLICFWDFNQRSSRHEISELAKLGDMLTKKGVEVALVHSAAMGEKASEWINTKGTPFHIGQITKESGAIRFKWGVRGLPWLILTDTEHKVVAEGFSVEELEKKLNGR